MEGYTYKVSATTAHGIPESMSNFIYTLPRNNGVYDIYDIIEKADGNAETAARLLNAHEDILRTFKPFRTFNGGFILLATDRIGNKSFISAKKNIVVNDDDRLQIVCEFVEAFEDFLDERGIDIPNDEKEQSPDSASTIYGTDFGDLCDRMDHLLTVYGVLPKRK